MGLGRGGGGCEYLKSAPGILDHWQPLFGLYMFFHLWGAENWTAVLVWMILCGVWGLISLIFVLLKVFGCDVPQLLLTIFYIIGAIIGILMALVMIILANVASDGNGGCHKGNINSEGKCPHNYHDTPICVSFTMGVFYIYSAVLNCGGK